MTILGVFFISLAVGLASFLKDICRYLTEVLPNKYVIILFLILCALLFLSGLHLITLKK